MPCSALYNSHVRQQQRVNTGGWMKHSTKLPRYISNNLRTDALNCLAAACILTFSAYLDGCTLPYSGKDLAWMSVKKGCVHLSSASGFPNSRSGLAVVSSGGSTAATGQWLGSNKRFSWRRSPKYAPAFSKIEGEQQCSIRQPCVRQLT